MCAEQHQFVILLPLLAVLSAAIQKVSNLEEPEDTMKLFADTVAMRVQLTPASR